MLYWCIISYILKSPVHVVATSVLLTTEKSSSGLMITTLLCGSTMDYLMFACKSKFSYSNVSDIYNGWS